MSQTSPSRPRLVAGAGAIDFAHAINDSYPYILPPPVVHPNLLAWRANYRTLG